MSDDVTWPEIKGPLDARLVIVAGHQFVRGDFVLALIKAGDALLPWVPDFDDGRNDEAVKAWEKAKGDVT